MPVWTPDIDIDDAIAERLLTTRFPGLRLTSIRLLGAGWDNHAYLVNEEIVFRIPHRKTAGELMETECAVLGYLAGQSLPLEVPKLRYQAAADEGFPYLIAGYPLLPGETVDALEWTDDARAINAEPLGHFLSILHTLPIGLPNPPSDRIRRADLLYRLPIVQGKTQNASRKYRDTLVELSSTPKHPGPLVWVHGDLYSRHLIADDDLNLTGVIDWGDAHVGDPALDIAIAWMFLPSNSWPAFKAAYGPLDDDTWKRARFRAMTHWAYLSEYAADKSDGSLQKECDFLYRNVLEGTD